VRRVIARGAALVVAGSAIGIAAAVAATRLLISLLFGVTATDPVVLAGAVVVLLSVGVLAAVVPARRASLTNPATLLRQL
jgi:ABC-type antimicrobial peptide transport system permease subunit